MIKDENVEVEMDDQEEERGRIDGRKKGRTLNRRSITNQIVALAALSGLRFESSRSEERSFEEHTTVLCAIGKVFARLFPSF